MELKFSKCFEFILIVGCGVFLHLNRISILDLKLSNLPGLVPSLSSTIFIFSILSILVAKVPSWPKQLKEPTWVIKLLIELFLILYVTDLVMRNFWVPVLKLVSFICKFLSTILSNKMPFLSIWIGKNGYYFVRFLIAISTFALMFEVLGAHSVFKDILSIYERQFPAAVVEVPAEPTPSASDIIVKQPIYGRSRSNSRSKKRVSFKDIESKELATARQFIGLPTNDDNQCSICHKNI
ncbi:hypothetical protein ACFFRR_007773 [Megaselia abdita]